MNQLYRDLIVKHYRNPFNKGLIKNTKKNNYIIFKKKNISCSDEITLQVRFDNWNIVDIKYDVKGCAILIASSSLMSIFLKNYNLKVAITKINNFCNMLQNKKFNPDLLEKELQVLKVISQFPGRFVCASTPWQLLLQMIQKIKK
ncbi:MAG: SUF system NifU family Fe-S cluster assembly protein [Phytoplasma sp.]|uniref:Fe-S cluster assembly sulfur transfer protein SufU n=1 Tax=Phytoplasma sp. TaxID=2155 RepID=UPI002B4066FA|nr:SUF system NifU family Fe-S cluster assembly protein [Phytoplasma sp.]WRH06677.1 MAG: SUF system NifU family Fe-S cluster assembly protein [Phytoplasma sp.]